MQRLTWLYPPGDISKVRGMRWGLVLAIAAATAMGCVGEDSGATPAQPDAGPTGDGGPPEPPCDPGRKDCVGRIPRTCDSQRKWHDEPACDGLTPVCSAGGCVAMRVRAGASTLGAPPQVGAYRLKDNGLDSRARICNGGLCVVGGMGP